MHSVQNNINIIVVCNHVHDCTVKRMYNNVDAETVYYCKRLKRYRFRRSYVMKLMTFRVRLSNDVVLETAGQRRRVVCVTRQKNTRT